MMVEQARITSVVGRLKTFRGRALKLTGEVEDRGEMELVAFRHEWPDCLLHEHVVGAELDITVEQWGSRIVGEVLGFNNQSPRATTPLMTKVMKAADALAEHQLNALPIAPPIGSPKTLPPPEPHPLAEGLNRLLEQEVDELDDPSDSHPF